MQIDQLKPNVIVTGPIFSESVQVLIVTPMGASVKLIGQGLNTNQVHQLILNPSQIAQLQATPDKEPFDGDSLHFRLGVEALRLGLAYEYDPFFALAIARVDPLPVTQIHGGMKIGDRDVSERTHYLFGKEEAQATTKRKKKDVKQLSLFDIAGSIEDEDNDWGGKTFPQLGNTILYLTRVNLDLPEEVFSMRRLPPNDFVRDMRLAAAIYWYQKGEVSQEKAAQIAGLNRRDFLAALAREEVDVFSVNFDDLQQELNRG